MLILREIPSYETLSDLRRRYPSLDPSAIESSLVLLRVASDAYEAFEKNFARHKISQGRFTVLAILNIDPEIEMCASELSAQIGVTRATMTGLLDGLERDRFIRRLGDNADRRKTIIALTGAGRRRLESMLPDHFKRMAAMMAGLTEKERKLLVALLAKVKRGVPAVTEPKRAAAG